MGIDATRSAPPPRWLITAMAVGTFHREAIKIRSNTFLKVVSLFQQMVRELKGLTHHQPQEVKVKFVYF